MFRDGDNNLGNIDSSPARKTPVKNKPWWLIPASGLAIFGSAFGYGIYHHITVTNVLADEAHKMAGVECGGWPSKEVYDKAVALQSNYFLNLVNKNNDLDSIMKQISLPETQQALAVMSRQKICSDVESKLKNENGYDKEFSNEELALESLLGISTIGGVIFSFRALSDIAKRRYE